MSPALIVLAATVVAAPVIAFIVYRLARGLGFLDPYGERTGERWRAFLDVLADAAHDPQTQEAAIAGALAGFRHAELRLCGDLQID